MTDFEKLVDAYGWASEAVGYAGDTPPLPQDVERQTVARTALLAELDAAREELAERKEAAGIVGRKMRDLGAENRALRNVAKCARHSSKVVAGKNAEIARQRHTIGRLLTIIRTLIDKADSAVCAVSLGEDCEGLVEEFGSTLMRYVMKEMEQLSLTWADAIEEETELDAAREELEERKEAAGIVGRKMRDLGAENWRLRDSLCRARWAHKQQKAGRRMAAKLFAKYLMEGIAKDVENKRLRDCLRWLLHLACGVGRGGEKPEPGEWEDAIDNGKLLIARSDDAIPDTDGDDD